MKPVFKGSLLAVIGFILSPLSWWNDLLVNIPIAYVFGWLASFICEELFLPAMIFAYWLTNIVGLLLLQIGLGNIALKEKYNPYKILSSTIISATLYSLLIFGLYYFKIIKLPMEYFSQ